MQPTNIEGLTKRIQELVPELMELSFGCRIKHGGKGELIFLSQKYCQKKEHDSKFGCNDVDYCNNLACLDPRENRINYGNCWTPYTILGHPINLEHCIAALYRDFAKKHDLIPFTPARNELIDLWKMMSPWESQTEVHEFLANYLLK